jgi:hypothetical protein
MIPRLVHTLSCPATRGTRNPLSARRQREAATAPLLQPSARPEKPLSHRNGRGVGVRAVLYGRYPRGSCATPLISMMKWTWGPVEIPVLPTGPMTSPLATASPAATQGGSAMCP